MKRCNACHQDLPSEAFHVRRVSPDGLAYACKECARDRDKQRYQGNRQERIDQAVRWNREHPEERRVIVQRSNQRHPEYAERGRAFWRERRADKDWSRAYGRLCQARRRAADAGSDVTVEVWQSMVARANGRCVYCDTVTDRLHMDHVDPVSADGKTEISNVVPCCQSCNSKKGKQDVAEWLFRAHGVEGLARAVMFLEETGRIYGIEMN